MEEMFDTDMIPLPLVDDIESGTCIPFVGAGFSMNAQLPEDQELPDWTSLTVGLAEAAGISPAQGGPQVASEYERLFGRVQLIEAIRRALYVDDATPGAAHVALAKLPFDTIYTTNFDLLLEGAFSRIARPFRSIVGELQMPFHGGPQTTNIVKMHGDVTHQEHIVITTEDYDDYLDNYPVIATHLSAQLITRTPLFIGYSLSDPDFSNIRKIVKSRLGKFERMAYVVRFDSSSEAFDEKLQDNLHIISLSTQLGTNKDRLLAQFLDDIQDRIDAREGVKFRASRPEAFEPVRSETIERAAHTKDASSLFGSSSKLCFVMMPHEFAMDTVYYDLIVPVAEHSGLSVARVDQMYTPGVITEQIRVAIQQSRLCIADLTNRNPNVLYEVGIAQTLGKPTVLLTQRPEDVPFDLRNIQLVVYDVDAIGCARPKLREAVERALGEDRFDEAQRLIDGGMYRAAAAVLGVLLEHSLRRLLEKHSSYTKEDSRESFVSLGRALRILVDARKVDPDDAGSLQRVIDIRNRAVHELEEPSADEVQFMLGSVRRFVDKYLGGWLQDT